MGAIGAALFAIERAEAQCKEHAQAKLGGWVDGSGEGQ